MNSKKLILVSGPPGVGKSTLSKALAARLGWVLLDKDCIDEPFSPDDRGPQYSEQIEPKVLRALLALATLNLQVGHSVILDAPWTHLVLNEPGWIPLLQETAAAGAAQLLVLECVLSETTLRARIAQRGLPRDAVKLSDDGWAVFQRSDCLGERMPLPHIRLDAEMGADVLLQVAMEAIGGVCGKQV